MSNLLGPAAAFGASVTWAFASTRYARISRDVGSPRVNFARALTVLPIYWALALALPGRGLFEGVTSAALAWLFVSVLSSYAIADSVFFTAARRIGVTTALSIASTYPLWAAVWGVVVNAERVTPLRIVGTGLCVVGLVALIRMAGPPPHASGGARRDVVGLLFAALVSVFWALNSISVQRGARGLDVVQANAIRYSMGVLLLAPQALRAGVRDDGRPLARSPGGGWLPVLPAILADALFGSLFYVYGLGHTDLAVGATLTSLSPLVSVPFALALGEERWNGPRFAAVCVTVAGVVALVASAARP